MKYDLKNDYDRTKAMNKLNQLIKNKSIIDLTEERPVRSISSNNYLHVLFSLYGIHFGHSLKDAKKEVKTACPFVDSHVKTSEMTDKEIIDFIEWFRNFSAMNGCYLCSSKEYKEKKTQIDNEIKKHKTFM